MAKVKIQGHASGTGILTVTAPNTSTDRTITLPDESVTLGAATPSIDDNGNATAITIDSSENVLIGKTTTALATAGLALGESGFASITRDGYEPLNVNRLSSDGNVISVYKDSVVKGSIAVTGSGIGIQLGGTDAAHTLDDYEEGTWTPSCATGTLSFGGASYVKVGTMVTVGCYVHTFSDASSSAIVTIGGLPFTTSDYFTGSIAGRGIPAGKGYASVVSGGITTFELVEQNTSSSYQKLQHSDLIYGSSANTLIFFSLTYRST